MTLILLLLDSLPGVAGALTAWALWRAMNRPQPVGWTPLVPWWQRTAGSLDTWIRARWQPVTRHQANILAIPPWTVLAMMGVAGAGGGLVGWDLGHHGLIALLVGAGAAWKGPAWWIGQQFHSRQSALARDFPPLVLMLRIYLALGEPLPDALRHTRPALARVGQAELDRLTTALAMGRRQAALKTWARRVSLTTYALLADTLAQGWDQGLSAEMLTPLDTLIRSSREQGTRALTDRLDGMATIVPIIAAFGVMAVLLYALLVGSGIG